MTSVPTDIVKCSDYGILSAVRDDGTPQNIAAGVSANFAQFLAMTEKLPALEENFLALDVQKTRLVIAGRRQRQRALGRIIHTLEKHVEIVGLLGSYSHDDDPAQLPQALARRCA
jgi:hypothetical protein